MVKILLKRVSYTLVIRALGFLAWVILKCRVIPPYQPNFFKKGVKSDRTCSDRYGLLKPFLPTEDFSFKDIGSNLGYFVFALSKENNGNGFGIDGDYFNVFISNYLRDKHQVKNISFFNNKITPENSKNILKTDVTVFTSVFHHCVKWYGKDNARGILIDIAESTQKVLVFETGQANEISSWADKMDFMDNDICGWLKTELEPLGFNEFLELGQISTSVSSVKRSFIVAIR